MLLVFGDTLVLDRWRWVRSQLPPIKSSILDAGCGNGWLAINCAKLGHDSLGLGWSDRDLDVAQERALWFRSNARFEVQDLRELECRNDLVQTFDVVTCSEVVEHIIDDARLVRTLAALLRPGGIMLLTAPSSQYVPIDSGDAGPFNMVEDGGHVRKGYSPADFRYLVEQAELEVEEVAYCSGRASQSVTRILRRLTRSISYIPAWLLTFPLRLLPWMTERGCPQYPPYSICLRARKPITG